MIGRKLESSLSIALLLLAGVVAAGQERDGSEHTRVAAGHADGGASLAAPGPVHQQLAKRVGTYKTVTSFVTQPGAPATESAGTAKIASALGGRFLLEENSGTFMGAASAGLRLLGYNNATRQYEGCWTYTMSTAIMTMTGVSSDNGKTVTLTASFDDEGGVKQMLKVVTRQLDDDHFVVELIGQMPDGKDGPKLTTTYTRTK